MRYLTRPALGLAFGLSGVAGAAQAQLEINLDYSAFLEATYLPAGEIDELDVDVNAVLNGASLQDAIDAMEHAAAVWEDVFANSSSSLSWAQGGVLTKNIDVRWAEKEVGVLASAGPGLVSPSTGQWITDGQLTWDGDGSSGFFVDTTPGDDAEWRQRSERSISLGGVPVNVERVSYDAPPGVVRNNNDFLSTAIHEITHTLGFVGGYVLFQDADQGGDGDIDITSGPFNGAEVPINGGHTNLSIATPGNDALGPGQSDFPYDPGGGSFSNGSYNPTNLAASINSGVRLGLTEADILIVAEFLGFDMETVNFNPLSAPPPVPGDLNGDRAVTNADIAPFVTALTAPDDFAQAYPDVDPDQAGDYNEDGMLTNADIAGFVAALTGGGQGVVPEPASLALLAVGGLLAARRR